MSSSTTLTAAAGMGGAETLELVGPKSNAVSKSSRARPNKNQYGWGNLPHELIK